MSGLFSPQSLLRRMERAKFAGLAARRYFALALLLLVASSVLRAEDPFVKEEAGSSATKGVPAAKPTVEQDIVIEGLASYGNYKIFASGKDCKLYTAGIEYDRHTWGRFLRARMDYVAEVLPVILLNKPVTADYWGNPTSYAHEIVPGFGISPIGFRLLWRDGKAIKPYLLAKGGILAFTEKVPSQQATYENFSLQSAMGVNVRMNPKVDLRLGLFSDFHFSNAFIVPSNPGLDVMNANVGISYHLGRAATR